MKKQKVVIAISGGVDSAVAAALLVKQGYEVEGWHLKLGAEEPGLGMKIENKCCSTEAMTAAKAICDQLGIAFRLINYNFHFKKKVVDYFGQAYSQGLTPNPCIACNKFIKFGELHEQVRQEGFNYLATGHYARIVRPKQVAGNGQLKLCQAKDKTKDQTYFLYTLTQEKLEYILFPIGDYLKVEVRKLAHEFGLVVAEKPESQEVCFVPGNDYRVYLAKQGGLGKAGEVVNLAGEKIGKHQGLGRYTIGQRHGFTVNSKMLTATGQVRPWYVVRKETKTNRLVVGRKEETGTKIIELTELTWLNKNDASIKKGDLTMRIRHGGEMIKLASYQQEGARLRVELAKEVYGVAAGQAGVVYCGDEVVGGGTIAY